MQFSGSDSKITWHVPLPEPVCMKAMHERPELTGRQNRITMMYRIPRMQFSGSDSTMAQGTVLSALFVSSASCAGLHTTRNSLLYSCRLSAGAGPGLHTKADSLLHLIEVCI